MTKEKDTGTAAKVEFNMALAHLVTLLQEAKATRQQFEEAKKALSKPINPNEKKDG
jgi:hypothetical protein